MTAMQLYNLVDQADAEREVLVDGRVIESAALVYDGNDNVRLEIRTKEKTEQPQN